MRCPACGATNPDTAAWCGQCYRRFDEPEAQPSSTDPAAEEPAPPSGRDGVAEAETPAAGTSEGFRRRGDELEWLCPQCATYNSIDLQRCAVCGTSFVERFRSDEPEPERNWSAAMLLSLVAPGAGHLAVGRYGSGWARLVLFSLWLLGALLLATSGGQNALVVATPLLLGALLVWAVTLVDVYRLHQEERELLVGRALLWLVVGVLILLGIALFASVGTATTPPPA